MDKTACDICGSNTLKKFDLAGKTYFECADCEAVRMDNPPEAGELAEYYGEDYAITADDYFESESRRFFRIPEQISLIAEIAESIEPPARILDVGCDKGYFLDEARRFGFDVCGAEPSRRAREYCARVGVECAPLIEETPGKFDVVDMWHSLEHFPDPVGTLKTLYGKLNSGGFIFVRVPNFACVYRKIFGARWIWLQPDMHYRHFTPKSLAKALEVSGFEVLKSNSRKPNNRLTKRSNRVSVATFRKAFGKKPTLKQKIARIYEDATAVEVFAIGKKRD